MVGEARQLQKDADELKRGATALLDQAVNHPDDATGLRIAAKARLEQAVEKLEEALRLMERAHRHMSLQMPTLEEEKISQMLVDWEPLERERDSLRSQIQAVGKSQPVSPEQ